jgi:hypothetical protein
MYDEAMERIEDANLLSRSPNSDSNSAQIIRVLAMEVLLKAAIVLSGQTPKQNHDYAKLWLALPGYAKKAVLCEAMARMPGLTDFSDLPKLLSCYQHVFEKARYAYEFLSDYSDAECRELGEFWLSLGAPTEEALVKYYPLELVCLVGLAAYLQSKLPPEVGENADVSQ